MEVCYKIPKNSKLLKEYFERENRVKKAFEGMKKVIIEKYKIDLSWGMVFLPTYITVGMVLIVMLIGVYQERKMKRAFDRWIKKR